MMECGGLPPPWIAVACHRMRGSNSMENVRIETSDGVAIIIIDRPKVLNALNAQTVAEIGEAFEQVRNDDAVKAVILTGGGEKAFVAGADIAELAKMTPISGKATAERGQRIFANIERFPKPGIPGINGFALGGGWGLRRAGHIPMASGKAQPGSPGARS